MSIREDVPAMSDWRIREDGRTRLVSWGHLHEIIPRNQVVQREQPTRTPAVHLANEWFPFLEYQTRSRDRKGWSSEAEQVSNFHEKLAAIVHEAIWIRRADRGSRFAQVAVVTDVHCSPGMD